MSLLITGAAGYLGRKLLAHLDNSEIICPCIPGTEQTISGFRNVTIINTEDNRFSEKIKSFSVDTVINIAGVYDTQPLHSVLSGNLVFPLGLLDSLSAKLVKWININTSLPRMFSVYSLSKHQLSDWGALYNKKFGFTFIDIQLEQFYGANDGRFISFVIDKLLADEPLELTECLQKRDVIHVDDVCSGIICLLDSDLQGYHSVPLGCGVAPSLKEVVEYCRQITSSASSVQYGAKPLRDGEPMLSVADISIMDRLGFKPKYDWKTGIRNVIGEMKK